MTTQPDDTTRWIDNQGDIWTLGDGGLMHTPETAPFSREHVERKWGPLKPAATQPAGEHHTGTLDLTGEGNAPGPPISDEIVQLAERAYETFGAGMQDALAAAYPAIRQQVAEEIAAAIEQVGDERSPDRHHSNEEKRDHGSTRYASYLDAASVARKIGGVA